MAYKALVFIVPVLALVAACNLVGCSGSRLLLDPPPLAMREAGGRENEIQLYECHYRIDPQGRATVRTHTILKVGSEGTEQSLEVFDGSMMRLSGYEARVISADGSHQEYELGDLASSTMSNRSVIAERSLRYVSLERIPAPGDLIESVSEHTLALPQLGIQFSPQDAGDRVVHASCLIEVPSGDSIASILTGDGLSTSPQILRTERSTVYRFDWQNFQRNRHPHRFARRNEAPTLFAVSPTRGPRSWKEFGDWYLGIIAGKLKDNQQIAAAAQSVVNDLMTDTQKMFAVARYCQSNIRYEQVYLEGGEIIPNDPALVFQHRYGDCKDYSTLMVVMAHTLGLKPDLVLCWRGKGHAFSAALPVSQFNHMIVHWRSGERDYWFDGTNPPEAIGVADQDLINARALILEPGASRLATINESAYNLLFLSGEMTRQGDDLQGKVWMRLQGQYAVDFLAAHHRENTSEMTTGVSKWISGSIASGIVISDLRWQVDGATFVVNAVCRFPNALWHVGSNEYVRFDKILNRLLPQEETELKPEATFYYPGYANVAVDVTIRGVPSPSGSSDLRWEDRFTLPPGPFDEVSRDVFLRKYNAEVEKASRNINLKIGE